MDTEDYYQQLMGLPERDPINDFEFIELYPTRPNELHPELMNIASIATSPEQSSIARIQMFGGSHIKQQLNCYNLTESHIFAGPEYRLSEYCFNVTMPNKGRVINALPRYRAGLGGSGVKDNPETILIYEYDREELSPDGFPTGRLINELDYVSIPSYFEAHQRFGFMFNHKFKHYPERINEGTILAQSPSISETGFWKYGIETNVLPLSLSGIIEDGAIASNEWCEEATAPCIETYVFSFGSKQFPLGTYSKEGEPYKIMPDIGEYVNEDGILVALRDYHEELAPVLMSTRSVHVIDHKYDRLTRVTAGAKVIDIKVQHDTRFDGGVRGKFPNTPEGMTDQVRYYYDQGLEYYRRIMETYEQEQKNGYYRGKANLTPKLSRLIFEAQGMLGLDGEPNNYIRTFRNAVIDEWRVEVTIQYDYTPGISSKITGKHGNKCVIVEKRPRAEMPIDRWGNRVDLIVDGLAFFKRMIMSAPQELFLNAAGRDMLYRLRQMVVDGRPYSDLSKYVYHYYLILNPTWAPSLLDANGLVRQSFMDALLEPNRVYPKQPMPTNNVQEPLNILYNMCIYYRPFRAPVTYKGMSGKFVETKDPMFVGSAYILVLEKSGDTWTGVSSAKLNNFGVPAKITSSDRYTSPARNMPIRFGESEGRLFVATVGPRKTADLFDRTNSGLVRKNIQEQIYRSPTPTAIESFVNRDELSRGNGRIHALVKHLGQCDGWVLSRAVFNIDEEENDE
jgi:hypothetical protein